MPDLKPFVGPPTEGVGCAYALDIDQPPCGEPEERHILVESEAWGLVTLASCGSHASIGRSSGTLLGEHGYTSACVGGECFREVLT